MKQTNVLLEEIIAKYLSGSASPEEVSQLVQLIGSDPEHFAYFSSFKNIWDTLHPAFDPTSIDSSAAWRKVYKPLERKKETRTVRFSRFFQRLAALLLLPLLLLSAYLYIREPEGIDLFVGMQEVYAPFGTYTAVDLPDGSKVWLNSGSSLRYPQRFQAGKRKVELKGEGYFEIESNPANPFLVQAGGTILRATGTAFNVEAYHTDMVTAITLMQGKLDIVLDKGKEEIPLAPGQRLSYNRQSEQYTQSSPDNLYKWYAWRDGKMIFRDDPLEYVFKQIGRTYNIDIAVKDAKLAKQLYRATFEGESLDEILRLLQMTTDIQYHEQERIDRGDHHWERRKIEVLRKKR